MNKLILLSRLVAVTAMLMLGVPALFAQNQKPAEMEKELVRLYAKIPSLYSGDADSLNFYSDLFTKTMNEYITTHPESLNYPFQTLIDSGCCSITTTADGMFRIYSWDTWMGGTMHFFKNIFQFRSGDKVTAKVNDVEEGTPGGFYSETFTVKAQNATYYLAVVNGVYSNRDASVTIEAFTIENKTLNDSVKVFRTKKALLNSISASYDFHSVEDRPERPVRLIKYDPEQKIMYFPIVGKNEKVTKKFILYQLKGQYFEPVPTRSSIGK